MTWLARTSDPVLPEITPSELAVASALADMAIARGGILDDYQTPIYLRGLVDLDPGLVTRACEAMGLEKRADFEPVMPPVGTIRERVEVLAREDAAAVAASKLLPAPVAEADERPYFCLDCRDESSALRAFWCRGSGKEASSDGPKESRLTRALCSRRTPHRPHTYVERCACADVNPVIAASRRRIDAARQQRETQGRNRP